jgi:leucyl/phenylalanyl-tRNA--protein transferase
MAEGGEVLWFSPLKRGLIPLDDRFHIPHGLKRVIRRKTFEVRRNSDFRQVIEACGARDETWIDQVIVESYTQLHEIGFAHSVECWDDEGLQGGLYGVALGRAFFGESMFTRKADASKVALVHLVEWLREDGYIMLDTQWMTDHLRQFGGEEISRDEYFILLDEALEDIYEAPSQTASKEQPS